MNNITVTLYWIKDNNWKRHEFQVHAIKKTMHYDEAIFVVHDAQDRPWYKIRITISDYCYIFVAIHNDLYILTRDCSIVGKNCKIR